MKLTGIQKRAARRGRNGPSVDLNLVSLIDIFTILIFFLLINMGVAEILPTSKAIKLPESTAQKDPAETLAVLVSAQDIVVEGRRVAAVSEVVNLPDDVIPGLKAELELLVARPVVRAGSQTKNTAITIVGDRDIPYRLLRKVMVTCARAGFTDVSFAVQKKAGHE